VVLPFNQPEAAARIIRSHGSRLAAVLIDLMPIYTGCVPATRDFLTAVTAAARAVGAVVILDEVISFRLGYRGGQGVFDIDPDLTTLAKIIGGGFPVGAVAGKEAVMAVFDHRKGKPPVAASGTFTANMVTMTAGRIGMELLTEEAFDRLNALGDRVRESLAQAMRNSGYPGQITGHGSIFKIHTHDRPVNDYRRRLVDAGGDRRSRRTPARLVAARLSHQHEGQRLSIDGDDGGRARRLRHGHGDRAVGPGGGAPQRRLTL